MVNNSRVAIIGAGSVGATIAFALLIQKISSEILLVDVVEDTVKGQVLDLSDANFISSTQVRGGTYQEAGQCDIIIITAGAKQKPNETRVQLIERNYKIMDNVINSMKPINPKSLLLLVANPVDVLTSIAQKISGLPKHQVFGSGTFLDSARLRLKLSSLLKVSETAIHCYVLGEHGDSQIIAWTSAHVGGKPLLDYQEIKNLKDEEREQIEKEIANKAYEIINLKGATYFGIAGCVSMLVQSITLNQRQIRPLSVYSEEYGCVLSMPAVLGSNGIERIIEVKLSDQEKAKLKKSAVNLKSMCDKYC
nr:11131_t:CDS:2 [Entrophospora candida]